jgi:amino acid permease
MLGLCIIGLVWLYVVGDFLGNISIALENLQESTFRLDMGIFSTIAISTGAFKAHYNAPRFFQELGSDLHSHVQMVVQAYGAAFLLYASFALAGYGLFGSEVLGNVLRNYPSEGNRAILLAWLGMAFAIVFTYPLVFTSARDSLVLMCPPLKNALAAYPSAAHIAITTAGVIAISLVACGVDDVSLVTGLLGATIGSALCWIIPACVYMKVALQSMPSLRDKQVPLLGNAERPPLLVPSRGMLGYAVLLVVLGTFSACIGVLGSLGVL